MFHYKYICKNHLSFSVLTSLFLINVLFITGYSQVLPQDFNYSDYSELLIDAGYLWGDNSTFHPLALDSSFGYPDDSPFAWPHKYLSDYAETSKNLKTTSANSLSVLIMPGIGFVGQNSGENDSDYFALQPFIWSEAVFNENFYAKFYFRASNESESLPHFSAVPRSISRFGLNAGEVDQSILGFRNSWAEIEMGRCREIWGPLAEENLLLSSESPPYEKLSAMFTRKSITLKWFYAYLETRLFEENTNINRYLVARTIEYKNRRNLIFSLGEVSVLSGPDRAIDWSFLNPLAVHVEIDQNDRANDQIGDHANGIWFANLDWLVSPDLRFIGAFILDDFPLERDEYSSLDEQLGYFGRLAWTPVRKKTGITLITSWSRMNTYALRHSYGYSNLVTKGELIGSDLGNDAEKYTFGFRMVFPQKTLAEMHYVNLRRGENSLYHSPYGEELFFTETSFPSGESKNNQYLSLKVNNNTFRNIVFEINGCLDLAKSGNAESLQKVLISARYQRPVKITGI